MKKAPGLGTIFGIEIGLDYSWFIVFALVPWSLASYYLMDYRWPASTAWTVGAITSLLLFASVLAHELGHSLVAIRKGIPLTSITLFIFGGASQTTEGPAPPRDHVFISISCPA